MLFVGTSIIHPSTEGVFLLCNILDLLIYSMKYNLEMNKMDYQKEKENRKKRLEAYAEEIQKSTLKKSAEVIEQLVKERHRQGMTQQDLSDLTGILPPNLARLESGTRVPTLVVLEKYASALGMHIEIKICEGTEE